MKLKEFAGILISARKAVAHAITILLIGTVSLCATLPAHASVFFNTAPIAEPGGPYGIQWGESLVVDGSASFDPDELLGDEYAIQFYEWDLLGNGSIDGFGLTRTFDFGDLMAAGIHGPGVYSLRLRVTDIFGGGDIAETVFAIAPEAAIAAVPEPETLALVLVGLGLASGFSRRRKT